MPAGRGSRRAKHRQRRHKGQANRDPARKYGLPPGGEPRNPKGHKAFSGIIGNPRRAGGQRR